MKTFQKLNKNEMKMIVGGRDAGEGGSGCSVDNLGLWGANCQRSSGAADKCGTNGSGKCTCGSL